MVGVRVAVGVLLGSCCATMVGLGVLVAGTVGLGVRVGASVGVGAGTERLQAESRNSSTTTSSRRNIHAPFTSEPSTSKDYSSLVVIPR